MNARADSSPLQARHLVLLGAGATHRRLVRSLARQRLPAGVPATWLVSAESALPLEQLAPCMAGVADWEHAAVGLAPLAAAAGLRLLVRRIDSIDLHTRSIELDRQERLAFDLLSIDPEPVQDRADMERRRPGARENALFACPAAAMAALWPRVSALPPERLRSTAVIGNGPLAAEIAFALRVARPSSAISLVTAGADLLPDAPHGAQAALAAALRRSGIDVLPDEAERIEPGALRLASGAVLRCDMPVIADGLVDPAWLPDSGLSPSADRRAAAAPTLQADPGAAVFVLPRDASPRLAQRHLANLVRFAGARALHPAGAPGRAWHAIWTGPAQALAFGRGWQVGGRVGSWLLHWHRR